MRKSLYTANAKVRYMPCAYIYGFKYTNSRPLLFLGSKHNVHSDLNTVQYSVLKQQQQIIERQYIAPEFLTNVVQFTF